MKYFDFNQKRHFFDQLVCSIKLMVYSILHMRMRSDMCVVGLVLGNILIIYEFKKKKKKIQFWTWAEIKNFDSSSHARACACTVALICAFLSWVS